MDKTGETWLSADPHYGHANIIQYCNRPFRNVEEMNEGLVDRWNNRVAPGDTAIILGDLALGKLDDSLFYASMLNGDKYLVLGNHDRPWLGHKRPSQAEKYEAAGFTLLHGPVQWAGNVVLSHFPVTGDSHDGDRYTEHRPTLRPNQWLLHGHVHNAWTISGRQINVGVDVWNYEPVAWSHLKTMMED